MKFERQKMVKWFSVPQLAASGLKALVSTVAGNYADKRETEAALFAEGFYDYSDREELWIDFISDLGDGFDSTYTMASLMAKDSLRVTTESGIEETIPRGKLLVMGGDQVYPTPSATQYKNRLQGPYNAAFPWKDQDPERPHLFAIPGNHDWYDGLSSFLKLFCQGRALGNWHTQQKRSYFALKLPHGIWLWGIDVQLNADIDLPQLEYFEKMVSRHMADGDRVILCTAEPAWIYEATTNNSTSYDRFDFFVKKFFTNRQIKLITVLTGDLHHYARYKEALPDGHTRQYITAGGGGAFMHSTHHLPNEIKGRRNLSLECTFPSKKSSFQLLFRNVFFPFQNISMPLLLATIYLFILWLLQSKEYAQNSFLNTIANSSISELFPVVFKAVIHNPAAAVLNALIFFGILAFTDTASGKFKGNYGAGLIHALLHLTSLYLLIWLFTILNVQIAGLSLDSALTTLLYILEMLIVGSFVAGIILGLYLIVCNALLGSQGSEAYSALRYTGFKNFLRMRISAEGITLYPIGVRKIVCNWKNTGTEENPAFTGDSIEYELIEKPIKVK